MILFVIFQSTEILNSIKNEATTKKTLPENLCFDLHCCFAWTTRPHTPEHCEQPNAISCRNVFIRQFVKNKMSPKINQILSACPASIFEVIEVKPVNSRSMKLCSHWCHHTHTIWDAILTRVSPILSQESYMPSGLKMEKIVQ